MNIEQILQGDFSSVIDIGLRKYFFVRTDSGEYFDEYYLNNFIAIGWNEISLNDLRNFDARMSIMRSTVRNNPNNGIAEKETESLQERAITTIINKNKAFFDLNEGDVVIMPSSGSNFLAFGIIQGEPYTREDGYCPHLKRRDVKWLRKQELRHLDAKFGYITRSFHAISEINDNFKDIIDNYMFDSYIKNDTANISFRLNTQNDISYDKLKTLIDTLIKIGAIAQNQTTEEVIIKLNLQSPGFVNLKKSGRGLIFALALVMASCSEEHEAIVERVLTEHEIAREDLNDASNMFRDLGGIEEKDQEPSEDE